MKMKVAIIGSGNIGTDLMMKIVRGSPLLELCAFVGIDPSSDGLARAQRLGIATTAGGIESFTTMPEFAAVDLVFDATSASAHHHNDQILRRFDKRVIDLTPAAIGPFVVPCVNLGQHAHARNINMVSCGGQATIPVVSAIARITPIFYAEIVASIASKSAGPGTRANIDEFTETTTRGIESVGGAQRGKAIIILNPAEPPLTMRDTVFVLCADADRNAICESVVDRVAQVRRYVPGYRLKQDVQFQAIQSDRPVRIGGGHSRSGLKVSVFLEVEGAGHYLPRYAGNLDVMTSAALATAERLADLAH